MKESIGLAAAVLVCVAYVTYFRDILSGRTKPHPISWFIWGLNSSLIFGLQITHSAGAGAYPTFIAAIVSFLVCALSIRRGTERIRRVDVLFLLVALVGVGCWVVIDEPAVAMACIVGGDVAGAIPTFRKAWAEPFEETLSMWTLSTARQAISLTALSSLSVVNALNPLAWLLLNAACSGVIVARRAWVKRL